MLEVRDLSVFYGDLQAVNQLDFSVGKGEIVALLGSNGAGKSSTLMALTGVRPRTRGSVKLEGKEIRGRSAHEIAHLGITQVPEGRRIFPTLSVDDNLKIGSFVNRSHYQRNLSRVFELFPILKDRRRIAGGSLSGGEQQMLAISRALMAEPRIILLDEPSLGLAPMIVDTIYDVVEQLRADDGMTFLIVEQNLNVVLDVADQAYLMSLGKLEWSGTARELKGNQAVQESYFGQAKQDPVTDGQAGAINE